MSRSKKKQKVGIMGGTFDPVHKGHVIVARTVLERYQLDKILFIPAFSPPHKNRSMTSFAHRVAMLEAALQEESLMSVSILEAERTTPSYTVETLAELHQRLQSSRFYLIIGADMFAEIELWYKYSELFKLADIIVAARPGVSSESVAQQVAALEGSFIFDTKQQMWCRDDGFRIFYCSDVSVSISSSEIRERIVHGSPVEDHLNPSVYKYIQHHGLYT